jgi:hypothetical protein
MSRYDEDYPAWAEETAARLRAAKLPPGIDWPHIIEELEGVGRSEYRSVRSYVRNVIEHLLKLAYATDQRPASHWRIEIEEWRENLAEDLTASQRPRIEAEFSDLYRRAVRSLRSQLIADGDPKGAAAIPDAPPFTLGQVLGDWLP